MCFGTSFEALRSHINFVVDSKPQTQHKTSAQLKKNARKGNLATTKHDIALLMATSDWIGLTYVVFLGFPELLAEVSAFKKASFPIEAKVSFPSAGIL